MKKLLLIVFISSVCMITKAQNITESISPKTDTTIFETTQIETAPECNGGFDRFAKYLANNKQMTSLHDKGIVYVQFVVETDGRLTQIKVVKSLSADADKIAASVIRNSPLWKPGIKNGQPVRARCTLPLHFKG